MLELSQKFENDIQGNQTHLLHLVVLNDSIYISTNDVRMEQNFVPIVKNISNINESIDFFDKQLQTSNVTIDLINTEINNEIISSLLFNPSVLNKSVKIYLKSQSCETLDDCLFVYEGITKNIVENKDIVSLEIEDKSNFLINESLPRRFTSDTLEDKYSNKPIPLVYGANVTAPAVYEKNTISSDYEKLIVDDNFIKEAKQPKILVDDVYMSISKNADEFMDIKSDTIYANLKRQQWIIDGDELFLEKEISLGEDYNPNQNGLYRASLPAFGFLEVGVSPKLNFLTSKHTLTYQLDSNSEPLKAVGNIEIFENLDNNQKIDDFQRTFYEESKDVFIDLRNYGDIPNQFSNSGLWGWGNINDLQGNQTANFVTGFGENVINFGMESFPNKSNFLDSIKDLTNNDKVFQHKLSINFGYEISVIPQGGGFGGTVKMPKLCYLVGNSPLFGGVLVDFFDNNDFYNSENENGVESRVFEGSVNTGKLPIEDIEATSFTIGQRQPLDYQDNLGLTIVGQQGGSINYIKLKYLNIAKTSVLTEYKNYPIYLLVDGRVDDVAGTFTGVSETQVQYNQSENPVVNVSSSTGGGY